MSLRFRAISFLSLLSLLAYLLILGSGGIMETREWDKRLQDSRWELERVKEENKNLLEKKKLSLNESILLEKETKKYYLMKKGSGIIKFYDPHRSETKEEQDKEDFWKILKLSIHSEDKAPHLNVLRIFHISFSIFLIIGVFFQLSPKKEDENNSEVGMNTIKG